MASEVITAAGGVRIVITGDGASFSATVADCNRQLQKLGSGARDAGRQTVTSVQAAGGAIRLLEGDITRNVRAVEKFITMIPGVGAALKVAFPIVGAAALAGVLVRLGEEAAKVIKEFNEAPDKIRDSFEAMKLSAEAANDELRKNNDELANQIAKLEGKPQNNLAIALDDARIESDKLQESLERTYQEAKRLLEENQTSAWQSLLSGRGSSGEVSGNIENFFKLIRDAGRDLNDAEHSGDQAGAEAARTRLEQYQRNALAYAQSQIAARQGNVTAPNIVLGQQVGTRVMPYTEAYGDQRMNITALKGMRDLILQQQDAAHLQQMHKPLEQRQQQLQHDRELQQEEKRAATQRMEQAQQELEKEKADHEMSLAEEAAYWQKLADGARQGSALYNAAVEKANKARADMLKQLNQTIAQGLLRDAEQRKQLEGQIREGVTADWERGQREDEEQTRKEQEDAVKAFRNTAERLKDLEREQEEQIKLRMQTGALSSHQGALQLQTLHQDTYAQWLKGAEGLSAQFPFAGGLVPSAQQTMSAYDVQSMEDAKRLQLTTTMGYLSDSMEKLKQGFTDTGEQLSTVFVEGLKSFNQTLIEILSTPANMMRGKHPWDQLGASFFKSVGSTALTHLEGKGIEAAGRLPGKVGGFFRGMTNLGTKGNPMHAIIDGFSSGGSGAGGGSASTSGSIASGVMGAASGVPGMIGAIGGTASALAPAARDLFSLFSGSSTASLASSIIPGFADGGPIPSNLPAIVGEHGPELFIPSGSGHIVPNDALGGVHQEIHVHVNGGDDPAATEARMHRAMRGYLPHISKLATASVANERRRRPSNRAL